MRRINLSGRKEGYESFTQKHKLEVQLRKLAICPYLFPFPSSLDKHQDIDSNPCTTRCVWAGTVRFLSSFKGGIGLQQRNNTQLSEPFWLPWLVLASLLRAYT